MKSSWIQSFNGQASSCLKLENCKLLIGCHYPRQEFKFRWWNCQNPWLDFKEIHSYPIHCTSVSQCTSHSDCFIYQKGSLVRITISITSQNNYIHQNLNHGCGRSLPILNLLKCFCHTTLYLLSSFAGAPLDLLHCWPTSYSCNSEAVLGHDSSVCQVIQNEGVWSLVLTHYCSQADWSMRVCDAHKHLGRGWYKYA